MSNKPQFSRRRFLQAGGTAALTAGAAGILPFSPPAMAAADMKSSQAPGFYRFKLGGYEVTVLSDGSYVLPTTLMGTNVPPEQVKAFLASHFLSTEQRLSHVNLPLINTGKELVLVDVGGGMNWMATAGKLTDNLKASGYNPEDVDKVILTHGHPDHLWGLIDEFEEAPRFPNAQYFIGADEWDFWATDKAAARLPEQFQGFAIGAKKHLLPVEEKVKRVKDGEEVAPGITMISSPGHTPGHMSVMVNSDGKSLLVTADAITHPYVSFEHPGWRPGTDTDGEMGEKSRKTMLDMAATDKPLLLVYHISFPGLGRVARAGNAYRWVPATWQWEL